MVEYSAGDAKLRIVPDARQFKALLEADLERVRAEFAVQVTADLSPARAEMEAFRAEQTADAIRLRVNTSGARGEMGRLSSDWRKVRQDFEKALKLNLVVAGADLLPSVATGLVSVAGALQQVSQAGLAVPGILAGLGASAGTLALGLSGVKEALTDSAKASDDVAASGDQASNAADRLRDAVVSEAQAQRQVAEARKDARQQLEDLNEQLRGGALDEQQAQLDVLKAQQDLVTGHYQTQVDVAQAQLRVEQARERVSEVQIRNRHLAEDAAEANAKGVDNADQVISANEALARSHEQLEAAQRTAASGGGGAASKAAADMAKLAPNARETVQALLDMRPAFDELKGGVQQNLFGGMAGQLKALAASDLPNLKSGLDGIATALNRDFGQLLASLGSDSSKGFLDRILGNTAGAGERMQAVIDPLVHAFGALTTTSSNVLPRLADGMGKVGERFDRFISAAAADGRLDKWINDGVDGLDHVGNTLLNVGKAFTSITKAAGGGEGLLGTLEKGSKKLSDFLNSAQGQADMKKFFTESRDELHKWEPIVGNLVKALPGVFDGARDAANTILPVFRDISHFLSEHKGLVEGIVTAYAGWKTGSAVLSAISGVGGAYNTVRGALEQFYTRSQEIPAGVENAAGKEAASQNKVKGAATEANTAMEAERVAAAKGGIAGVEASAAAEVAAEERVTAAAREADGAIAAGGAGGGGAPGKKGGGPPAKAGGKTPIPGVALGPAAVAGPLFLIPLAIEGIPDNPILHPSRGVTKNKLKEWVDQGHDDADKNKRREWVNENFTDERSLDRIFTPPTSYERGGITGALPGKAEIRPPTANLVQWAEPSTGGEAFIPLKGGQRSIDIWQQTGHLLGAFARGGVLRFDDGGFSGETPTIGPAPISPPASIAPNPTVMDPGQMMLSQGLSIVGNAVSKNLGSIFSGLLGSFGLQNSILSPNNSWNQAISQVLPHLMGAGSGMPMGGIGIPGLMPFGMPTMTGTGMLPLGVPGISGAPSATPAAALPGVTGAATPSGLIVAGNPDSVASNFGGAKSNYTPETMKQWGIAPLFTKKEPGSMEGAPPWVNQLAASFNLTATDHADSTLHGGSGQMGSWGFDFSGSPENMQRFADFIQTNLSGQTLQAIWQNPTTGKQLGIAGGQILEPNQYYTTAGGSYADHMDHVHWATDTAPIFVTPDMMAQPGAKALTLPAQTATAAPSGITGLKAQAFQAYSAAGLPADQWSDFDRLITRESGWSATAQNPKSSAYGLGQFLDSTWASVGGARTDDPGQQMALVLKYIQQRYGGPSAAWAHEVAEGWYDGGFNSGPIATGTTIVHNETGQNEAIFTNDQVDMFKQLADNNIQQMQPKPGAPSSGPGDVQQMQPRPAPAPQSDSLMPPPPSAPPADGGQQNPLSQLRFAPPSGVGGPPQSTDHELPAIKKAVTSAASTLGSWAAMAASMGMAAGGGGAGGGAAGSLISGLFSQGGKIVNDAINVPSSFLVGNITPGTNQNASGETLRPQQNVPVTAPTRVTNYGGFYGHNTADVMQELDLREAQEQQAHLANRRV